MVRRYKKSARKYLGAWYTSAAAEPAGYTIYFLVNQHSTYMLVD